METVSIRVLNRTSPGRNLPGGDELMETPRSLVSERDPLDTLAIEEIL